MYDKNLKLVAELSVPGKFTQSIEWMTDSKHLALRSGNSLRLLRIESNRIEDASTFSNGNNCTGTTGRLTDGIFVQTNLEPHGQDRSWFTVLARNATRETVLMARYQSEIANEGVDVRDSSDDKLTFYMSQMPPNLNPNYFLPEQPEFSACSRKMVRVQEFGTSGRSIFFLVAKPAVLRRKAGGAVGLRNNG